MAESILDSQGNEALQHFHNWRQSPQAQMLGIGGPDLENTRPYIPQSNLEKYFGGDRLKNLLDAVLSSKDRHTVDEGFIRRNYLQTFATLLCIGHGNLIHLFAQYKTLRDGKLPHRTKPADFPFTTPDAFEVFRKEQSQFCPPKLEYNMNDRSKEDDILPIIRKEKIGQGGSAVVYKIVVDRDYNALLPSGQALPEGRRGYRDTFVLKTYYEAEGERTYKDERDAYLRLRYTGEPCPNLLTYFGGFVHGSTHNIILEWADIGTLETYMSTTDPPSTTEELVLFWDRFRGVANGLLAIHGNGQQHSPTSRYLNGMHHDIKPANILVFGGNQTSRYDCYFKVADLGLTQFHPTNIQSNDDSVLDVFGTRAYGAPESFRSGDEMQSVHLRVTKAVDIWSLGCVFSEVAVWAQYGWRKVLEYRRQRSIEIEQRGGGDGEYNFHYDGNLLYAVESIHLDIKTRIEVKNLLTRLVLEPILDMLQCKVLARPTAYFAYDKLERIVKDYEKRLNVSTADLIRSTNGEVFDSKDSRPKRRVTSQYPLEHNRGASSSSSGTFGSPQIVRLSLRQPQPPPDDDLMLHSPPSSPSSAHIQEQGVRRSISTADGRHTRGVDLGIMSDIPTSTAAIIDTQARPTQQTVLPHAGQPSHSTAATANTQVRPTQQTVPPHAGKPSPPTLSVDEGLTWRGRKKAGICAGLKGDENLTSLNERDHIFLIDNSATMKQYDIDMKRIISLLAYIVKDSDKDGLDLFFTQDNRPVHSTKSSKLADSIDQVRFRGKSDMRGRLNTILQDPISKFGTLVQPARSFTGRKLPPQPQRGLSFYILTDAKWQPNNNVGGFIKDLVKSMRDKHVCKEHVAIQFIRFGHDPAGINLLNELDHGLGLKGIDMDIVDHTYWNGNVWKMLLGALNDWYDDDPM